MVLHPPGEPHANRIEERGLEVIGIELESEWLQRAGFQLRLNGTRCWIGGRVAAAAHRLVEVWRRRVYSEFDVAMVTARFLRFALTATADARPVWIDDVSSALNAEKPSRTADIARALDLHPAWLARAYRTAVGEGIHETLRRKRIERAAAMLRGSDWPLAQIAVDAGFCDQSHMNRVFRAIMGRTPLQIRAEQASLSAFNTQQAN